MNKVLVSMFSLAVLAGCSSSYDYYQGGVKYTQDGPDCVYFADEQGDRFSDAIVNMNGKKTIVYRNTLCASLYDTDTSGLTPRRDRAIWEPSAKTEPVAIKTADTCQMQSRCQMTAPVLKRRYVIVPVM